MKGAEITVIRVICTGQDRERGRRHETTTTCGKIPVSSRGAMDTATRIPPKGAEDESSLRGRKIDVFDRELWMADIRRMAGKATPEDQAVFAAARERAEGPPAHFTYQFECRRCRLPGRGPRNVRLKHDDAEWIARTLADHGIRVLDISVIS